MGFGRRRSGDGRSIAADDALRSREGVKGTLKHDQRVLAGGGAASGQGASPQNIAVCGQVVMWMRRLLVGPEIT